MRLANDYITLSVFEANEGARNFYRKYGFVEVGRTIEPDIGFPEILMALGEPANVESDTVQSDTVQSDT